MIKILVGRQTDQLQEQVLQLAVTNYQQSPEQETFVIVPNHIKFTTEVRAISKLAVSQQQVEQAVKNLQVLSFSRLAWFFLKDAPTSIPSQLDDAAAAMLLAKIIEQKRPELHLFKSANISPGLVKQLYETILEVRTGNLDLDDIDSEKLDLETKNKLADLKVIYDAFIAGIAGKFSTSNEVQLQLNEYLASQPDLQHTDFYFSDFSHFTLQECLTIKLLMLHARSVTLAFKTQTGDINRDPEPGDYDYVIQTTINQLLNYINQHKLPYQVETVPISPVLNQRERLNDFWTGISPAPSELNQVQLVRADNRYAEAYFVARTIYQQVALQHYRYRDFLVLAPNLHEYETYLTPILRQNNIPFFNDLEQEMKYHPLVVLIENIAQLATKPLQTQNLLTIMKTHLIIPKWYKDEAAYLQDVDQLENFVLAHGINHQLWQRDFTSFVAAKTIRLDQVPDQVAKINKLKNFFVKQVTDLLTKLAKEKDTQQALTVFFNWLTQNGVPSSLEKWREAAQDQGDLQQARQSEQVWDLLINLLRDYLLINPAEFTSAEFFAVLVNGFKEATFSQIPSTLDAVDLSETGIVQVDGYKQVFILGATSNGLPQIQTTPGFLSTENLEQLSANFGEDAYLEDRQQLSNLDQNYQFGLSLALAQDQVYLSYAVAGSENEAVEPSLYYERFKKAGAAEFCQHDLPEKRQELLSFLTNPEASLGYLTYLQRTDQNVAVDALLKLTAERLPQKTALVLAGSQFINEPTDIGAPLAQQLYGENLNSSVSQLETFYGNSFEYFLNYGLRLRKRFDNELDVIQAGNYFHETFDRLVKELSQRSLDLAEIDEPTLKQLLDLVRGKMKAEARYQQLLTDPFNQFLFNCLDQTTTAVAGNWHQAVQKTPLRAKYAELSFGLGEQVTGLNFELPDLAGNHQVNLRGKMDRVDLAPVPEQKGVLAQVIDYKSSAQKFNLGLFYNGISLQMVSYLDVLAQNQDFFAGQQPLALLGAFYQTVTRQVERLNGKNLYASDLTLKQPSLDGQARLKYTGLINNDQLRLLEAEPELKQPSSSSQLYAGISAKKDGSITVRGNAFNDDELKLLLEYDEALIKGAASQILAGKIKLNPYQYGKAVNALAYSDYRDILFFDAMLKENQYHRIGNLSKKELLAKIKAKLGKDE
ncbi:PD-(D/E)XK nuclease family protein [Lactobacillus xylocopicola]|uniref:ATP-dependent helicase/deoxyribonuclease subunit B n=1 Tax=Lactobacillus xylocopicola TaxID=2976676 RepID=A0ABM8BGY3_9LACO|nr:PD-(D/E)XK nuclease family protein [Lactobacillus xylocopicola]BDR60512.1 ATP-dependent helicase/deoxyribonuclease subunit B [Lactobacillus xylocopicola]